MKIYDTSIDNDDRIYRGIVEDNNDPQKVGRVRVRIVSLHGEKSKGIKTEHLPWAYVTQNGAGANSGSFIVPEIGAMVMVLFENGNHNSPIVIGTLYATNRQKQAEFKTSKIANQTSDGRQGNPKQNDVPEDGQQDIASRVIYRSPKGTSITIYDQDDSEAIELKDANGQVLRLSSPLTQEATANNKQEKGNNPEGNLVNVSTILLKNPFGQLLQILSNGQQGIITLLDEPNMQGIEINSALGFTRMFNKKGLQPEQKGGVEVYVNKDYAAMRTEDSEFLVQKGKLSLSSPQVTIISPKQVFEASQIGIKASNITLSGKIALDGQTVSNSTIKAHFIHGTGNASSPSTSGKNTMLQDETSLVGYVNPKDKLDKKAEKVLTEAESKLSLAKTMVDTSFSLISTAKQTMGCFNEISGAISDTLADTTALGLFGNISSTDSMSIAQALAQLADMPEDGAITPDSVKDILDLTSTVYIPQSDGKTTKVENKRTGQLIYIDNRTAEWMQGLRTVDNERIATVANTVYNTITAVNNVNQQLTMLKDLKVNDLASGMAGLNSVGNLASALSSIPGLGKVGQVASYVGQINNIYNQLLTTKKLLDNAMDNIKQVKSPTKGNKETKKGAINRTLLQSKANAELLVMSLNNVADALDSLSQVIPIPAIANICKAIKSVTHTATTYLNLAGLSIEAVTGNVKASLELLTALSKWGKL